jgi:glycosyltransferase involved in cell wall biosynthesis
MRVTHLVAHVPFREGTGTACYYNALGLRALGWDVTVHAPARNLRPEERALPGYRFMRSWLSIENAFLTPDILSIRDTDIVHLHLPFIFGAELVLAGPARHVPLVVTYHNDLLGGGIRRPAFAVYNRVNNPLILRRADRIAVVSLDHAASSFYGSSIFRRRRRDVAEIGNGVDTSAFQPEVDSTPVRERHGLRDGEVTVLFVAHLDRAHVRKGLDFLLETLASLDLANVRLLVVGDGELRPAYADRADGLGLGDRVVFAGRVAHAELPGYYTAADMVVIPSRPPESFGLALAEGMASGRPVIGCNIPGVRTVVTDGETGFLVEPGDRVALRDRISTLVQDPPLREAMGARGRQRVVEHYSWDIVARRLSRLYEEVLGG